MNTAPNKETESVDLHPSLRCFRSILYLFLSPHKKDKRKKKIKGIAKLNLTSYQIEKKNYIFNLIIFIYQIEVWFNKITLPRHSLLLLVLQENQCDFMKSPGQIQSTVINGPPIQWLQMYHSSNATKPHSLHHQTNKVINRL